MTLERKLILAEEALRAAERAYKPLLEEYQKYGLFVSKSTGELIRETGRNFISALEVFKAAK